jgi:uncharacterized protein (UPF0548 family)
MQLNNGAAVPASLNGTIYNWNQMFRLSYPTKAEIDSFIASQSQGPFSYAHIGLSMNGAPAGFNVDHNRIVIGSGELDLERAKTAIRNWEMFNFPWVKLCWPDTPIETGRTVAIVVKHLGSYSINACRIVYTIDETDRFGFAYGTLAEHAETGEERFTVEFDRSTGNVSYDLFAFSKPNQILAKLGYPIARYLQKRFARESKAAMRRAVNPVLE